MKLSIPLSIGIMAAASCCCCGDLFEQIANEAGVEVPNMGGGADIPDAMGDVGLYPGGEVEVSSEYGGTASLTFYTDDTPKDVAKWYAKEMKAAGWEITLEYSDDSTGTVQGKKGDKEWTIAATKRDGRTYVALALV